jgi:hypothetical protein
MSFPVILLIAGVLLVLIGLTGRVTIEKLGGVGTESRPVRVVLCLLGFAFLIAAGWVYLLERPPTPSNTNTSNTSPSPVTSPTPSPAVRIKTPAPNDEVGVKLDDGAAVIPVTGVAEGFAAADVANSRVYVFTSTEGSSEWWYHRATDPDDSGEWRTTALSGSRDKPAKRGHVVEIRAVLANEVELQNATGGKKYVNNFSKFPENKRSRVVSITLAPR